MDFKSKPKFLDSLESPVYKVTQTGHGFSKGNVIYRDGGTNSWKLADVTDADKLGITIISDVVDANTFTISLNVITGLSGLTDGTWYYVDNSGNLTTIESSISNPLGVAISSSELAYFPYRPVTTASVAEPFASMYVKENSTALNIQDANIYHATQNFSVGETNSYFTFTSGGATGSITAFTDILGVKTEVTSASHGLSEGDIVNIYGTTNYDGIYQISNVTISTYEIDIVFVADDATGTWLQGDTLKVNAGASGYYKADFWVNLSTVLSTFKMTVLKNAVESVQVYDDSISSAGRYIASGLITLATDDRICLGFMNTVDNLNLTVRNGNLSLIKAS